MVSVWLLSYDHKYGTDIGVHATAASALRAAAQILSEYSEDIEVHRLLSLGLVEEAMRLHSDSASEYLSIEKHQVRNLITAVEELADAASDDE